MKILENGKEILIGKVVPPDEYYQRDKIAQMEHIRLLKELELLNRPVLKCEYTVL
jgi:hypothetical protein